MIINVLSYDQENMQNKVLGTLDDVSWQLKIMVVLLMYAANT